VKAFEDMAYHPTTESIVEILQQKTQNDNKSFFRILTNYYLTKMAAVMRVKVNSRDRGIIPVNFYGINLASSGQDKNHSANIIEESLTKEFRNIFFEQTFPLVAEEQLAKLATSRAYVKDSDPDEELVLVQKEFEGTGKMLYSFDSGTTPAIKQYRHKLKMCKIGALNMEIDEVGSNLTSANEVLTTFLELYDVGQIKEKLIKNTKENIRNDELPGRTPANLIAFGTPAKLLDGGKTEELFYTLLDTGYARRCFFGYTKTSGKTGELTPEQVYDQLISTTQNQFIDDTSNKFAQLANRLNWGKQIIIPKDISLLIIEYRLMCERQAELLGDHAEILKAEMSHRYWKAMKLAGVYAFIDGEAEVSEDHFYAAVKLAEDSGKALTEILKRDRNYVKLAKYIASIDHEVTHADLTEDLPFYRGAAQLKQEMLQLAIAWGYKHHIVIQKTLNSNIEFLRGKTLKETDLNQMRIAYSKDIAEEYKNVFAPFNKLHKLTQQEGLHWISHHTVNGHRHEDHIIPGFNMVVLDVDDGTTMEMMKNLFEGYTFMIYTTKRHTVTNHRFRVVLPINYFVELDKDDYKEFMHNFFEWLPIQVDTATGQRSRKWLTNKGTYEYIEGDRLIDALEFIPKTAKNDDRKKIIQDLQSLSNLERWFVNNIEEGNRSNQLVRYGLMLVDSGQSFENVRNSVLALNNKLQHKLDEAELTNTIFTTISKAIAKR